jgi:hypothetical protein
MSGNDDADSKGAALQGEVLPPESGKKPRYRPGSRKGKGGVRSEALEQFKMPMVINFIMHCIREKKSDSEIARLINVPQPTFHRWKKQHPELWIEANSNSENPTKDIEEALVKKAKGFMVERPVYTKEGKFKGTKFNYYPPDLGAITYYLNNRAPADWKQKVEHNHAIEELPLEVTFVRASDKKQLPAPKAVTDEFGNLVMINENETQGKS